MCVKAPTTATETHRSVPVQIVLARLLRHSEPRLRPAGTPRTRPINWPRSEHAPVVLALSSSVALPLAVRRPSTRSLPKPRHQARPHHNGGWPPAATALGPGPSSPRARPSPPRAGCGCAREKGQLVRARGGGGCAANPTAVAVPLCARV